MVVILSILSVILFILLLGISSSAQKYKQLLLEIGKTLSSRHGYLFSEKDSLFNPINYDETEDDEINKMNRDTDLLYMNAIYILCGVYFTEPEVQKNFNEELKKVENRRRELNSIMKKEGII